ncbi:hypothetical protein ACTXT7_013523 [Hymenolepis weldensis]
MSSDVSNTRTAAVSLNSRNSTQSLVAAVSSKALPTSDVVQAVNDDMNFHPPVRDSATIKSSKCLRQCNHFRAKTKLVSCLKRSALIDR